MKQVTREDRVDIEGSGSLATAISLLVVAAVAAFLLSILSSWGSAATRFATVLGPRLEGEVTVVVWGHGLESADAAVARAAEIIGAQPGMHSVAMLDPQATDTIVGDLVAQRPAGMEGTRLIAVYGSNAQKLSATNLRSLLAVHKLTAAVDDHRRGGGPLLRQILLAGGLAISASMAIWFTMFVFCFSGGSREFRTDKRIELMVRLGARPSFIGASVGRRLGVLAFGGAMAGAVSAAILCVTGLFQPASWLGVEWVASIRLEPRDAVWNITWPALIFIIAVIGGGFGASNAAARRNRWV